MDISLFYENIMLAAEVSHLEPKVLLAQLKEEGMDGVYISYGTLKNDRNHAIPDMLQELNLMVEGLYGFFEFEHFPESESYKDIIDLAVERKAKNVLLVPGFVQKEEAEKEQELIENMQTGLRHAVEYGKEKQIDVSIEDFDALTAPYCRIAVVADFLEKVPGLKFSFDTGNFVMYHEKELEAFELFRDKICTLHLKDRCRESEKNLSVWKETTETNLCTVCADGEKLYVVPAGEGFLQIREIMTRLKQSGYDGGFIAELYNYPPEHMQEGIRKSIRWIKETWENIDCR